MLEELIFVAYENYGMPIYNLNITVKDNIVYYKNEGFEDSFGFGPAKYTKEDKLSPRFSQIFLIKFDNLNINNWQDEYINEEPNGIKWNLNLKLDGIEKSIRGVNAFPDNWSDFIKELAVFD